MKPSATDPPAATVLEHHGRRPTLDTAALDFLPNGILTCHALAGSLTVTYANRICRGLLGLTADDPLIGKPLNTLLGDLLPPDAAEKLYLAVSAGQTLTLSLPRPGEDSADRLRLELRPASEDEGDSWVGSLTEEHRRSPLRIKSAQLVAASPPEVREPTSGQPALAPLVREILDAMPGLISVRDPLGRFVFVNRPMAEFCGRDPGQFGGRTWGEVQPQTGGHAALAPSDAETLAAGRPVVQRSVTLADALGRARVFDIVHRPLSVGADGPRYVLSMATEAAGSTRPADQERSERAAARPRTETQLQEIAQRIPGAIARWSVSEEGDRLRYVSAGVESLGGYTPEEILEDPARLFHGTDRDSRAGVGRAIARAARDLAPFTMEIPIRHRESQDRRWLRLSVAAPEMFPGEIILDGLITEITDSKDQERAILDARNQLQQVTASVPGAVYQVRLSLEGEGRGYLFVSDGCRELFGIEPHEVLREGALFERRVIEADRAALQSSLRGAVRALAPWSHEFRIRGQEGDVRWAAATAAPGEIAGDTVVYSGIITDATERHETVDRLRATETQLSDAARALPGFIFQQHRPRHGAPKILFISEGCRDIYGLGPEDIKSLSPDALASMVAAEDREELERALDEAVREMRPVTVERRVTDRDGNRRWLESVVRPRAAADGGTILTGLTLDVTPRKEAEQALARTESHLQQILQSLPGAIFQCLAGEKLELSYVSEAARELFGIDPVEAIGPLEKLLSRCKAHGGAEIGRRLLALSRDRKPWREQLRMLTAKGESRWLSLTAQAAEGANGSCHYHGVITDTTSRVEAERGLEKQLEFSRLIAKVSSDFVNLKSEDIDCALTRSLQRIGRFAGAERAYLAEGSDTCRVVVSSAGLDRDADSAGFDGEGEAHVLSGWQWLGGQLSARELVKIPDVRTLPQEAAAEREDLLSRGARSFLGVPLFIGEESLGWLGFEFSERGRGWSQGELRLFRLVGEIIAQAVARRRGERALQAAEDQVREITGAIPGVVTQFYRSPEGRLDFRHLSGGGLTGVSLDAALLNPEVLLERIDERDREGLIVSLEQSAEQLTRWQYEYRAHTVTGDLVWVSACAHPRRLADGGTLFNGIAIDVTPRKKAEEALRASEERLRRLYESTPIMMHSTDARGRIVSANPAWLLALGYSLADVLGRRASDFVSRSSRQHFDFDNPGAFDESGASDIACQMVTKDGDLIDALVSGSSNRAGDMILGADLCIVDITERNGTLRALQESEQRYRAVVQDQSEMICRFDGEGRLQFVNDACVRVLERDARQLIGTSWCELFVPADRDRAQSQLAQISAEAPLAEQELRFAQPSDRYFRWTIRGFFAEGGTLLGYQAVGRDIQELKELERGIREVSHREQERIGHDLHDGLGQELTGISLILKTLERAAEQEAPGLRSRVRSVRDLVEQSIATARGLAQGLSPVHLERDGFAGALSQLVRNTESIYGVPVSFSAVRAAPIADSSATLDLYRIAQEALTNAAKHSSARQITVKLTVDEKRLELTVADDGRGLSASNGDCPGMGLRIMRYRANMIGASLDIIPAEGGGTDVRCVLRQDAGEPD